MDGDYQKIPVTIARDGTDRPDTINIPIKEKTMPEEPQDRQLSEDERMWMDDLEDALQSAHASLETAEGPADELQLATPINALDDITEARKMVEHALGRLTTARDVLTEGD